MAKKIFFTNLQQEFNAKNIFLQIYSIFNLANICPLYILNMINSAYFVKSTPPRAFSVSF